MHGCSHAFITGFFLFHADNEHCFPFKKYFFLQYYIKIIFSHIYVMHPLTNKQNKKIIFRHKIMLIVKKKHTAFVNKLINNKKVSHN